MALSTCRECGAEVSDQARACPKIVPLSVAHLFARAILSIHQEDSVSSLFEIQY